MVTVTTKEELENALKNNEATILVTGDLARVMQKKKKIKKAAMISGAAPTSHPCQD